MWLYGIAHVNCPVCTCVQYVVVQALGLLTRVPLRCVSRTHLPYPWACSASKISLGNGKLFKTTRPFTGKCTGSKEITKNGKAKDHDQDDQKDGTKGKSKGKGKDKGKDTMNDNEIKKGFQKERPQGWG